MSTEIFETPGQLGRVLMACPGVSRLSIRIRQPGTRENWDQLAEEPAVAPIRSVRVINQLRGNFIQIRNEWSRAGEAIARSSVLKLEELKFNGGAPASSVVESILVAKSVSGLKSLEMAFTQTTAKMVAKSRWMAGLTTLEIDRQPSVEESTPSVVYSTLLGSPHLANLRRLVVSSDVAADSVLGWVADSSIGGLESLSIDTYEDDYAATEVGLHRVGHSSKFAPLKELKLIVAGRLESLSAIGLNCPLLETLELSGAGAEPNTEGNRTAKALLGYRRLRSLTIHGMGMTSNGARTLASHSGLKNLRTLALEANELDQAALNAITHSPNFPVLAELRLSQNILTSVGPFHDRGNKLKGLVHLSLGSQTGGFISSEDVAGLLASPRVPHLGEIFFYRPSSESGRSYFHSPEEARCDELLKLLDRSFVHPSVQYYGHYL